MPLGTAEERSLAYNNQLLVEVPFGTLAVGFGQEVVRTVPSQVLVVVVAFPWHQHFLWESNYVGLRRLLAIALGIKVTVQYKNCSCTHE